jgi:hypothetical protein
MAFFPSCFFNIYSPESDGLRGAVNYIFLALHRPSAILSTRFRIPDTSLFPVFFE